MRNLVLAVLLGAAAAAAQTAGPVLTIDAAAGRKPISPDIYGINDYGDAGLASELNIPVRRWGGDQSTRYNWKIDTYNAAADWYFGNFAMREDNAGTLPDSSKVNSIMETGRRTGSKVINTIPMIGWLPTNRDRTCGFSVRKYGPQDAVDPNNGDCGNGKRNGADITNNDPNDVSFLTNEDFQREWVEYLVKRYGTAAEGGPRIYALDNEMTLWQFVHRDVHPEYVSYDELLEKSVRYASMIKSVDPTAEIAGPDHASWMTYFYSPKDWKAGWSTKAPWKYWTTPIDREAHGGVPLTDWFLQQMRNHELRTGTRILHYLDLHGYVIPEGLAFAEKEEDVKDPARQRQRLDATRAFWDPTYPPMTEAPFEAPRLIPRMREWVANNYPGTKTAITEYNFGAHTHINGALALADALGIFGREGLDLAAIWGPPKPNEPAASAFRMYRNYDGMGGAFGETSIYAASEDQGKLSIYAAERSDSALTAIVINKGDTGLDTDVRLANFQPAMAAQVWRYSASNLERIARENDINVQQGVFRVYFPPASMTLLVIPLDPLKHKTPKPTLGSVTNAASYGYAIAPGTIATLFGTGMGPKTLAYVGVNAAGILDTEIAGTRVLFDGVPAPMIYTRADQVSVVVPYEAGLRPFSWVQVEYLGHRSGPVKVTVAPVAPGIFALNAQGFGQAAVLNQDNSANSSQNPEARGRVLQIFATGEGETVVPSVNGLLARRMLPQPKAEVLVELNGITYEPEYAGAAPQAVAGMLQVNVRIPSGVPSGVVSLRLKIGDKFSQERITVAVK